MDNTQLLMMIGLVVVALGLVGYSLFPGRREESETVKRRTAGLSAEEDVNKIQSKAKQRAGGANVFERAAPLLSRPVMPKNAEDQTNLRARLASAGFRRNVTATVFLASKTVGAVVGAIIGGMYAANAGKDATTLMGYVMAGLGVGFMLPNLWLNYVVNRRMEAITHGLPDALDLMVVGVEAGLGLDAALQRVGDELRHAHPALSEEMQIAAVETQMGVPRAESLNRLAERTAVPEMRALVAVIVQAEKLGTSIATALRTQSDSLRTKRRQKAEERAQKTAVKLLLPLILFIFPTIFVVLAGPAAISLMRNLGEK